MSKFSYVCFCVDQSNFLSSKISFPTNKQHCPHLSLWACSWLIISNLFPRTVINDNMHPPASWSVLELPCTLETGEPRLLSPVRVSQLYDGVQCGVKGQLCNIYKSSLTSPPSCTPPTSLTPQHTPEIKQLREEMWNMCMMSFVCKSYEMWGMRCSVFLMFMLGIWSSKFSKWQQGRYTLWLFVLKTENLQIDEVGKVWATDILSSWRQVDCRNVLDIQTVVLIEPQPAYLLMTKLLLVSCQQSWKKCQDSVRENGGRW